MIVLILFFVQATSGQLESVYLPTHQPADYIVPEVVTICGGHSKTLSCNESPHSSITIMVVRLRDGDDSCDDRNLEYGALVSCDKSRINQQITRLCQKNINCVISFPECLGQHLEVKYRCATLTTITTTTTTTTTTTSRMPRPSGCDDGERRGIFWSRAQENELMERDCPRHYGDGKAWWKCGRNGDWIGSPNMSECVNEKIVEFSKQALQDHVYPYKVDEIINKLIQLTSEISTGGDIEVLAQVIQRILASLTTDPLENLQLQNILAATNILWDENNLDYWLEMSSDEINLWNLTQSMQSIAFLKDGKDSKFSYRNMDVQQKRAANLMLCKDQVSFEKSPNLTISSNGNFIYFSPKSCSQSMTAVTLTNMKKILESKELSLLSDVVVVVVKEDASDEYTQESALVSLRLSDETVENVTCSQWSFHTKLVLTTEGCSMLSRNSNHITCRCNIPSIVSATQASFTSTSKSSTPESRPPFTLVTHIGCGLCVACLIATFLMYFIFRKVRTTRHMIYQNYSACQAVCFVVFIFGINETNAEVLCTGVAVILHYLLLVSNVWLLADAIHLYLDLMQFKINQNPWFCVFSYALPLPVVIISLAVNVNSYGSTHNCWLRKEDGFVWAYAGPAFVLFWLSIALLCVTGKTASNALRKSSCREESNRIIQIRFETRSLVLILLISYLSWLFGLIHVYLLDLIPAYLFSLFSAAEGVCVLSNAALDKTIRSKLGICFRTKSRRSSRDSNL